MGGYQFSSIYVIVFKSLRWIHCVFKSFHSGDRFQKFAVTVCVFAGYVWTLSVTATKLVRCVKRCLKKTLKNARVSFEEFETVLTQVEGILNSRPLTYVHEEMSEPLTPSTLCVGRRLLSNPLPQERKVNKNLVDDSRRRERFPTRILNHFWERWRKEYLTELRERHKVRNGSTGNSISHGDVVVVHEDKIPRQLWKVGRVENLLRGRDGNVRAAIVRTSSEGRAQQLLRTIQRVYPIEISAQEPKIVPPIKFVRDDVPDAVQNFNARL